MTIDALVIGEPLPSGPEAQPAPEWLRLQKLFRHTLKAGEVNPLLLIVPQYRQEEQA